MADHEELTAALSEAQRLGFLGARPIAEVIEHARAFVECLDALAPGDRVIDLGSGGGVPGLVIANDRPDLLVVLLDRRSKRTDFLQRVTRRLDWIDRVSIIAGDVDHFHPPSLFDAAVARGFGPPTFTLRTAARLVRNGGLVVISQPPSDDSHSPSDRWDLDVVSGAGCERMACPTTSMAVFVRCPTPSR